MTKAVDSYRFIRDMSKRLIRSWIKLESPREIPWTSLTRPLSESTVALISTGGSLLRRICPLIKKESAKIRGGGILLSVSSLGPRGPKTSVCIICTLTRAWLNRI